MDLDSSKLCIPHLEEDQGADPPHSCLPLHLHCLEGERSICRRFHECHAHTHQGWLLVHMGTPADVPHLLRGGRILSVFGKESRAHRHLCLVGHQPCSLCDTLSAQDPRQLVEDRLDDV